MADLFSWPSQEKHLRTGKGTLQWDSLVVLAQESQSSSGICQKPNLT